MCPKRAGSENIPPGNEGIPAGREGILPSEDRMSSLPGTAGATGLPPSEDRVSSLPGLDELYSCTRGTTPLVLSIPHSGLRAPESMAAGMTAEARALPDTDWRVDELYDFAPDLGATVLKAHYSRYVVDLNRPPDGASLYPGQAVTGLCPVTLFNGRPVYVSGQQPDDAEIERRRGQFWDPYHRRLKAELQHACEQYGQAILFDCHSIAAVVPRLFEGRLPALNLGTNRGLSCAPAIQDRAAGEVAASGYTHALNGRFIGGFITRRYGRPQRGRHALQMEIAQDAYMDGARPESYNRNKAAALKSCLRRILETLLA